MDNSQNASNISELLKYSQGTLVELPSFGSEQPFKARLKRPSVLNLAKSGKIPNTLMATAISLFSGDTKSVMSSDNLESLSVMFDVMEILCEAAFVEPTWKELKDNNIELTDEQLMAVFRFTQDGVKALESFR